MIPKKILALDLEGTLISNAMSQFPRPGLYEFMEFCFANFPHVVLYSAVRKKKVQEILRSLTLLGEVPTQTDSMYIVDWESHTLKLSKKFLAWASKPFQATPEECLLVDDMECFAENLELWVPIKTWETITSNLITTPYTEYDPQDKELWRVQEELQKYCTKT